jgi:hypothetical protein
MACLPCHCCCAAVLNQDELETQVYQLLPAELVRSCEAIAAKGGPAPPPPGMVLPQHMLPPAAPGARGGSGNAAAAAGAGGRLGADGSSKPTRSAR